MVSKDANGNVAVNNVQKGYTSVTSAGTTTTLTAASTYAQRITGTSAQTIQLPDTTTLTNGHTFIIDNDSTGAVTVNTSTATLLDTVSAGSLGYFFVEDNTVNTVAGWGKYAYLPGSVDWGTASVTGVPSITTSAANFSLLTPTTNSLTLDSGTTGAVNLGTNANAKVITIGNTTTGTSVSFLAQGAVNTSFNFSGGSAAVLQTPGGTGNPSQNLTLQSGTTSQSTTSNTNSGSLTITTAAAANTNVGSGNATSGSITVDVGAATSTAGSQTNGSITIGGTNAASIAIGRSGVTTTVNGSISATPLAATTTTATSGIGYMGLPQNSTTTGSYTIVAADAGKHIYASATRTVTIDSNTNLALPIGTTLTFIAGSGATMTIAITTDTMYLAGPGTTGSRTLAPFGMATAVKITSTAWMISGNGLT